MSRRLRELSGAGARSCEVELLKQHEHAGSRLAALQREVPDASDRPDARESEGKNLFSVQIFVQERRWLCVAFSTEVMKLREQHSELQLHRRARFKAMRKTSLGTSKFDVVELRSV